MEIAIDATVANNKASAEHQRLKDTALKAVKKWRANFSARPEYSTGIRNIDLPLARAVDDLIAYEEQNGIGDK